MATEGRIIVEVEIYLNGSDKPETYQAQRFSFNPKTQIAMLYEDYFDTEPMLTLDLDQDEVDDVSFSFIGLE